MEVDDTTAEQVEPDNAEVIERILGQRIGKKGGTVNSSVQFQAFTRIFFIETKRCTN